MWNVGAELSVGHSSSQPAVGRPGRLWGDERLAREVAAGNDRAFATLFHRYHQQLYRYCRSLTRDERDAEDALQSALTKALVALREDRRNAPVRPWLYRIAHNESISLLRSRQLTAALADEHEAPWSVVESVEQRERLALLLDDLQELPERQRGALVMRELNGLSHEEIGLALEVSAGAAKQTILEARRSLLEFTEGRAMPCEDVRRVISDQDRRSLRSRRVRAHLRGCARCSAFAAAIPQRRADLQALCPIMPAAGAASLLTKLTGAGSGHGGGGTGLAAGSAAKGIGTAVSIKAAATGAAVIATLTVGAVTVLHHAPPAASGAGSTPVVSRAGEAAAGTGAAGAHGTPSSGAFFPSTAPGYQPRRSTHHAAVVPTPTPAHPHPHPTPAAAPTASPTAEQSGAASIGAVGDGGAGGAHAGSHPADGRAVVHGAARGLTHASIHRATTHPRSTVRHSRLPHPRRATRRHAPVAARPHRTHPTTPVTRSTTASSTTTTPAATAPTTTSSAGSPPVGHTGAGGNSGNGSSGGSAAGSGQGSSGSSGVNAAGTVANPPANNSAGRS